MMNQCEAGRLHKCCRRAKTRMIPYEASKSSQPASGIMFLCLKAYVYRLV